MQELIPVVGGKPDVPSPFADDFDLIPVGCDGTVAPSRRYSTHCLHRLYRIETDIPVELTILYPDFILMDKDFCRQNEPVNEQNKRGCGEKNDRCDTKSMHGHGRYPML